jgi:hypothetical protein
MRSIALIAAVVALAGCARAEAWPAKAPDGAAGNWVGVSCRDTQEYCHEKADAVCPGGYEVADAGGHEGRGFVAFSPPRLLPVFIPVPAYRGHMLIRCVDPYRSNIVD